LGLRGTFETINRVKRYLENRRGLPFDRGVWGKILGNREELFNIAPLLTVNETYFFREGIHFQLLFRQLLPRLARLGRPLRICSAATSSGCEAYSIAMVADFFYRSRALRGSGEFFDPWTVDAFDVNPEMIAIAQKGLYTPNALRKDGSQWKFLTDLYPRKEGLNYKAPRLLRRKVRFFTHNVMEALPGLYDIIFFRNALIYFSPESRRKVLRNLQEALIEGGSLLVGVSETASVEEGPLELAHRMGAFYFTKRTPALRPPEPQGEACREPPAPPQRPAARAARIARIARIMEREEGRPNARRVLEALRDKGNAPDNGELAAAALTLLNDADFSAGGLLFEGGMVLS
jgi:chemotaxis protein methyltransferase CheR